MKKTSPPREPKPIFGTPPIHIADLLVQYRQAKEDLARLRVALCEIVVNEFGIDQSRAPQVAESFLDGYLVGQGILQPHRKPDHESEKFHDYRDNRGNR